MSRKRLKKEFLRVFGMKAPASGKAKRLFESLAAEYRSAGRAWHTLEHIRQILAFLKKRRVEINDWPSVQLAAWFHDVVYDTKAKDNEEQSALYARECLKQLGIPPEVVKHTTALIRATKKHKAIPHDKDSRIFLDADLSILGSGKKDYDNYAAKIRKEYAWAPEELYRTGRKKALTGFLKRKHIYFTAAVRNELEKRARRNLRREIAQLTAREAVRV
ncbi:MAG: hypothetical protein HZA48_04355 [Planctomycetes bacterium]|nr:hypothetical protein [Planctomycetota bacterium]